MKIFRARRKLNKKRIKFTWTGRAALYRGQGPAGFPEVGGLGSVTSPSVSGGEQIPADNGKDVSWASLKKATRTTAEVDTVPHELPA